MNAKQLDFQVDRSGKIPLYQQIYRFVKQKIERGEWISGTMLPPQRKWAEQLGVNRSTVVTAIEELRADGYVETIQGSKTVVTNVWELLSRRSVLNWNSYIEAGFHRPNLETVQRINEVETDRSIIRLSTGETHPDFHLTTLIQRAFQTAPLRLSYGEPKGSLQLRQTLVKTLARRGIEVSPECILIVSGALQALQLISIGILPPESNVYLEQPSYLFSLHVFQSAQIRLTGVETGEEGLNVNALARLVSQHPPALVYTNPTFHNPTGSVMSLTRRKELLAYCHQQGIPILEDEVYADLWLDEPPPPALKALDTQGQVLYIGSMSKVCAPGLRIGWLIGPEKIIDRLADIKMQTDYGSSSLSQHAVSFLLQHSAYEQHLARVRHMLKKRRDWLLTLLQQELSGLAQWNRPSGGFYVWLRPNVPVSIKILFERLLSEGILIHPGNIYQAQEDAIRLSYVYASEREMAFGIARLAYWLRRLAVDA
jgi:GntR family transcriptional regulator of abcA and norABC